MEKGKSKKMRKNKPTVPVQHIFTFTLSFLFLHFFPATFGHEMFLHEMRLASFENKQHEKGNTCHARLLQPVSCQDSSSA
jgi:hypothetical protein